MRVNIHILYIIISSKQHTYNKFIKNFRDQYDIAAHRRFANGATEVFHKLMKSDKNYTDWN